MLAFFLMNSIDKHMSDLMNDIHVLKESPCLQFSKMTQFFKVSFNIFVSELPGPSIC